MDNMHNTGKIPWDHGEGNKVPVTPSRGLVGTTAVKSTPTKPTIATKMAASKASRFFGLNKPLNTILPTVLSNIIQYTSHTLAVFSAPLSHMLRNISSILFRVSLQIIQIQYMQLQSTRNQSGCIYARSFISREQAVYKIRLTLFQ